MDEKQTKDNGLITTPVTETASITPIQPVAVTLVPPLNPRISYDDFAKVELKVGKIIAAEAMPKSEKLLKLTVDFAEGTPRTILSGIAKYFPNGEGLVGRKSMFVTNLEPRKMMGLESNGMILAVSTDTGFSLLEPNETIPEGTKAK